jgi:hypothetical protein
MARGQDPNSAASAGPGRHGRTASGARVITRFKRLSPKLKALEIGQQKYADQNGRFDRDIWEQAFTSADPSIILDVHGVIGVYVSIVNHVTEMMMTAASERGLAVIAQGKPAAAALYAAIKADGGLTASQADRLKDLNWARNELEHSSPTISAEQTYDAIVLLQKSIRPVLQSYVNWLQANNLNHLLA